MNLVSSKDKPKSPNGELNLAGTLSNTKLEDTTAKRAYRPVLEVTINHPRTKRYKELSYGEKRQVLIGAFEKLKHAIKNVGFSSEFVTENCRDGMPHLHGYLQFHVEGMFYIEGLVMDVVRYFYKECLPRYYWKQYVNNRYHAFFQMYRSPAICVNFKEDLHPRWKAYMYKDVRSDL